MHRWKQLRLLDFCLSDDYERHRRQERGSSLAHPTPTGTPILGLGLTPREHQQPPKQARKDHSSAESPLKTAAGRENAS